MQRSGGLTALPVLVGTLSDVGSRRSRQRRSGVCMLATYDALQPCISFVFTRPLDTPV